VSEELSDSFLGAVVGFVLFLAGFPIVFFNEQREVKMWSVFSRAADICKTDVAPSAVEASNEACLVHVCGNTTGETLEDADFGVQMKDAAKLRREVEMLQWVEISSTENRGQQKVTETKYEKKWKSALVDSSKFKKKQQFKNPPSLPIDSSLKTAKVKLGAFELPSDLVGRLAHWTKCNSFAKKSVAVAGRTFAPHGENLVSSATPGKPEVGDVRVRFSYVPCGDCTVMAVQHERSFLALRYGMPIEGGKVVLTPGRIQDAELGKPADCDVCCCGTVGAAVQSKMEVFELHEELLSADLVLARARQAQAAVHSVLLVVGWVCLVLGLKLMLDLVPALLSAPFALIYGVGFSLKDFLASVGGFLTWLLAIVVGTALYALTYAVAWLVARPLKGLVLILLSAGLFYLPYMLSSKE
jgi:hypothetical protein